MAVMANAWDCRHARMLCDLLQQEWGIFSDGNYCTTSEGGK